MSLKAAKSTEAPVTEWETFDGETYGYSDTGARIVSITGSTRASMWGPASNVRGWAAYTENGDVITTGDANGLRESKRAALAALRTAEPVERVAPAKGKKVRVNDNYPSGSFRGRVGKVESSAQGDDGKLYVTVDFGTHAWPFLVGELDLV
jgi:hypothetical protein